MRNLIWNQITRICEMVLWPLYNTIWLNLFSIKTLNGLWWFNHPTTTFPTSIIMIKHVYLHSSPNSGLKKNMLKKKIFLQEEFARKRVENKGLHGSQGWAPPQIITIQYNSTYISLRFHYYFDSLKIYANINLINWMDCIISIHCASEYNKLASPPYKFN